MLFVVLSFAVVLLLSVLAAATARLAIDSSVRFYWQCTLIFAVLAISSAILHEVPVMNILTMMWKNLRRGYQTLLFPARPKVTARFRGLVQFDPALCTGCAICNMRCTSRAIEFKAGKGEFTWSYNPGQCTFCGRCVEGCTEHALKEGHAEHALSQQQDTPPDLSRHRAN